MLRRASDLDRFFVTRIGSSSGLFCEHDNETKGAEVLD
jgi:hypothetical protein